MVPESKQLYVVFHGLFLFFHRKQPATIEVYLPDLREKRMNRMGGVETHSPHVYQAGNWLGETAILPGSDFRLEGVVPGKGRFDRKRNIVLPGPNQRSGVVPYARITCPRPAEVIPMREVDVQVGLDVVGDSASKLQGSKLCTIPVFRYEVPDETKLRLDGHPWMPAAVDDIITLHVYAEPEVPQDMTHSHREFERAFALLDGVDLRLSRAMGLPERVADYGNPPRGIHPVELEDLVARRERLAVLGRLTKTGQDPSTVWNLYGENPAACTGGAADDDPDD